MIAYICVHDELGLQVLTSSIKEAGDQIIAMLQQVSQVQESLSEAYVNDLVCQQWLKTSANWSFCECNTPPFAAQTAWEMYLDSVQVRLQRGGYIDCSAQLNPSHPARRLRGRPRLPRLPLLYGPLRPGGMRLSCLGIVSLGIGHISAILMLFRTIEDVIAWQRLPRFFDGVFLLAMLLCLWPLTARLKDAVQTGIERDTVQRPERWACLLFGAWTLASLAELLGILPPPGGPVVLDALLFFFSCFGALAWIHAILA